MKKFLVLLVLLAFNLSGSAQSKTQQEKSFLTLRAGISKPIGKFGNMEGKDKDAELAILGFCISAEFGRYFNNYVGLGLTYGMRRNNIDISNYNRVYFSNYYVESKWRTNFLLTNLYLKLPASANFNFYLKGGGGFSFNIYPVITNNSSSTVPEPKITAEALAYGFGGGFKGLVDNIGLGLEVYSLHTSPTFGFASTKYKQDMNDISLCANLSFQLK